jgi:hypothetical protein
VAAQLTLDGHVRTLARVPAKSAGFPNAAQRCHSVRDSPVPGSLFQDIVVASEKTAMLVVLLTFFSASLPRKPMRVILLGYTGFSCSARLSRAPGSERARSPDQKLLFWVDRHWGSQDRNGAGGKAEARGRRAPQEPRSSAEIEGGTGNGPETVTTWWVAAAAEEAVQREIVGSRPGRRSTRA